MDQDRLRAHTTDQQCDRLRDCVSAVDQARQGAREIDQAMNEWRNQYRKMSQEMGVKPQ